MNPTAYPPFHHHQRSLRIRDTPKITCGCGWLWRFIFASVFAEGMGQKYGKVLRAGAQIDMMNKRHVHCVVWLCCVV